MTARTMTYYTARSFSVWSRRLARSVAPIAIFVAVAVIATGGVVAVSAGDPIRDARCFAKCYRQFASEQPKCYSGCLNERWTKPGECPVSDPDGVVSLDRPCLEQCSFDDFCHGVYKCCRHSCGITCQPPVGLADCPGLPDEPNVVAVSDYGKTALVVEWSPPTPETAAAGHVTYVLQERHHVGAEYVPERMTTWATVARIDKTREQFKQLYAPGRWFQFRVAAINENGTRGYSPPSEPFLVELGPHIDPPGPPENLMVSSLRWSSNKEYQQCVLSWTPPADSALPVRKYKVFISVHDGSHVYHKRHVVSADILRFPIKKLNSNSEYFLQVQAISEFGRKKLAGQKASTTLKTKGKRLFSVRKISGLRVANVKNVENNFETNLIMARISWRPVSMSKKRYLYTLLWSSNDCEYESKQLKARTRMAYFDLLSLKPQCKYSITVSTSFNGLKYVGSIIFTTPAILELENT